VSLSILVVEDELTARRVMTQYLQDAGYAVSSAANGQEAITLLEQKKFDIVISDFQLRSQMTGIDVLSHFERVCPGKGKILVTAFGSDSVEDSTQRVGAIYVLKPLNLDSLLSTVKSLATEL
jgi:DNA-binding NtrC family response regulator